MKNELKRKCLNPTDNIKCYKIIHYKHKNYFNKAKKENRLCMSCTSIKSSKQMIETKRLTGNWGIETKRKNGTLKHTETGKVNISNGLKRIYKNGERTTWNAGLTAKTDIRVAKTGKSRPGKDNPNFNLGFHTVWIKKYGKEMADEMNDIRIQKMFKSTHGVSYNDWIKKQPKRKAYYNKVQKITNNQNIHLLDNFDKRGQLNNKNPNKVNENIYHLDHIISIQHGFENDISPEKIGDISNLRFIPGLENVKKGKHNG